VCVCGTVPKRAIAATKTLFNACNKSSICAAALLRTYRQMESWSRLVKVLDMYPQSPGPYLSESVRAFAASLDAGLVHIADLRGRKLDDALVVLLALYKDSGKTLNQLLRGGTCAKMVRLLSGSSADLLSASLAVSNCRVASESQAAALYGGTLCATSEQGVLCSMPVMIPPLAVHRLSCVSCS
jgi:hypothetical protein